MKKMKINYYRNNIPNIFYFIILLFLAQKTRCLLEFPLEIIKTNSNYNLKYSSDRIISKNLIEEGITKINPNHLFLANIKIGSQSQPFRLILDTGSSITWVADINSKIEKKSKELNSFDPYSSSSCKILPEMFNIKYGTGECSG